MARYLHASFRLTAWALLLAGTVAPRALASGFQLRDQSGSGQGNAYAGISAGGSDISSMFFNPAAMSRYEGNHLQLGLTGIDPSSKFSGGSATRSAVPGLGIAGTSISGAGSTGNVASSVVIPTVYAMWTVDEDLKLGLSVNVPFGLTTNYDPGWAGRYHAIKSYLQTTDITPSVAYRMDPKWAVGGAIVVRRAKAELSQGLDLGSEGQVALAQGGVTNPGVVTGGAADGSVDVNGSGIAYGYKLGLLYDPSPKLHLGLGYQSAIRERIKGTATFSVPTATLQQGLAGLAGLPQNAGKGPFLNALGQNLAAATADGSVSAVLRMPATISLGAIYDYSSTFSLAAEVSQTRWSTFKELRLQFSNSAAQPDNVTQENWKNAMFYAVGATCHPDGAWTYRVGLALDQTPVPDDTRTPRIPDADRTWVSGGVSYQFSKLFGLDAGYSHLFCKNSTVNLQAGSNPLDQSDFYKGNLTGTYKNSIDILAVQARFAF